MSFVNVSRRQDTAALRPQRHSGRIYEHSAKKEPRWRRVWLRQPRRKELVADNAAVEKITAGTGVAQTGVAEEHVATKVLAENVSSGDEDFLHGVAR